MNTTRYDLRNGQPVLVRLPKVDFIDDSASIESDWRTLDSAARP